MDLNDPALHYLVIKIDVTKVFALLKNREMKMRISIVAHLNSLMKIR